jgi:hypothetical protein
LDPRNPAASRIGPLAASHLRHQVRSEYESMQRSVHFALLPSLALGRQAQITTGHYRQRARFQQPGMTRRDRRVLGRRENTNLPPVALPAPLAQSPRKHVYIHTPWHANRTATAERSLLWPSPFLGSSSTLAAITCSAGILDVSDVACAATRIGIDMIELPRRRRTGLRLDLLSTILAAQLSGCVSRSPIRLLTDGSARATGADYVRYCFLSTPCGNSIIRRDVVAEGDVFPDGFFT